MGRRFDAAHDRMEQELEIGRGLGISPSLADMGAYSERMSYAALADMEDEYHGLGEYAEGDDYDVDYEPSFGPEVLNQVITTFDRTDDEQHADYLAFLFKYAPSGADMSFYLEAVAKGDLEEMKRRAGAAVTGRAPCPSVACYDSEGNYAIWSIDHKTGVWRGRPRRLEK